jgi:hypothetical protein
LISSPILAHPDYSKPLLVDTDASEEGLGAFLAQVIDGKEQVFFLHQQALDKVRDRYCVTRKEHLAVIFAVNQFKHYSYGHMFTIRTYQSALRWLLTSKKREGQMARWAQILNTYDIETKHRAGLKHRNADSLSRYPYHQCGYKDDWNKKNEVRVVQQVTTEEENTGPDNTSEEKAMESFETL